MLVVSTAKIYGDQQGRLFCESYRVVPNNKYDPTKLLPIEYAISAIHIPHEFYTKFNIYYVDTAHNNKLVCAYEYEDKIAQIKFIENDILGVTTKLSDNVVIHAVQTTVKDIGIKVGDYDITKQDVSKLKTDLTAVTARLLALEKIVTP